MIKDGRTKGITSPKDRSGLKDAWINFSEEQLNALETEAIFEAQRKYLIKTVSSPLEWFNSSFLFKMHHEMLSAVWNWAGKVRTSEKNIGVKAYLISSQLEELCKDVAYWNTEPVDYTFLEQACWIHYRLAFIHPFEDGNGRFSRLVADRYLKAHGCSHAIWPEQLHKECDARSKYIAALEMADAGDLESLITFTQAMGAKDPTMEEFTNKPLYQKRFQGNRFLTMQKALLRRQSALLMSL
ncbi:MAG: mobile mystery protein B [Verrucomicrobia bacterium]|nr:mobile mystery protein B [Verrucomicrobiota bacterium]